MGGLKLQCSHLFVAFCLVATIAVVTTRGHAADDTGSFPSAKTRDLRRRSSATGPQSPLNAEGEADAPRRKKRGTIPLTHSGVTDADKTAFIDTHNAKRRAVDPIATDMQFMTYDETAAGVAQTHADKCVFQHNPNGGGMGENLYMITTTYSETTTAENAVNAWYNEVSDYTYSDSSCTAVCGHYTQVVWATSNQLGCGIATCQPLTMPGRSDVATGTLVVCNYKPAGNFVNQKPYQTGSTSCSACPTSGNYYCDDKLCRVCSIECQNGGSLDQTTCQCDCGGTGYSGDTCQTAGGDSGVGDVLPSSTVILFAVFSFVVILDCQ